MVEVRIEEMFRSDRNRPRDYERAVVVDAQDKEEQRRPLFGSERRSMLKKCLTGPTLLEMSGNSCRLRRSTQHLPEVYSQESEILKSFSGVDSSAARPG